MVRLVIVCTLLALSAPRAWAELAYTHRDAVACIDPRAVRALNNGADPRQADPAWIMDVARRGQCGTLPGGTPVTKTGEAADLARIVASNGGRPGELFIARADLGLAPPVQPHDPATEAALSAFIDHPAPASPAPPPLPAPAAGPWQFSASSEGLYTCQIAADSAQGRLALVAVAARPRIARLLLQRTVWGIPPGTLVHATLSFAGDAPLQLVGIGDGTDITVDLTEVTLPPFLHGLTGAPAGTVTFTSVTNEPPWTLDLRGAAPAAAAMAACVRDHHINAPPPLGETRPMAALTPPPPPAGRQPWSRQAWSGQASSGQGSGPDDAAPPSPRRPPPPARRAPAAAPPAPPVQQSQAQPSPEPADGTKAYVGCLRSEARSGQYTTGNADHNALTVLSQCIPEWRKWMDDCRKTYPGTGRDCTIDSIALAKLGIYASGKRTD